MFFPILKEPYGQGTKAFLHCSKKESPQLPATAFAICRLAEVSSSLSHRGLNILWSLHPLALNVINMQPHRSRSRLSALYITRGPLTPPPGGFG